MQAVPTDFCLCASLRAKLELQAAAESQLVHIMPLEEGLAQNPV